MHERESERKENIYAGKDQATQAFPKIECRAAGRSDRADKQAAKQPRRQGDKFWFINQVSGRNLIERERQPPAFEPATR